MTAETSLLDRLISRRGALALGTLLMLQFLLTPGGTGRIAAFGLYIVLALFFGKYRGWGRTTIVFLVITVMNLFPPAGKVILSVGRFNITAGPLKTGMIRAATFSGLFLLSRIAIRPGLNLPGAAGQFVSDVFGLFNTLQNRKGELNPSSPMKSLDNILLSLSLSEEISPEEKSDMTAGGYAVIVISLILNEALLLLPLILEKYDILRLSK